MTKTYRDPQGVTSFNRGREVGMSGYTKGRWVCPEAYPSEVEREDGKTIASCWHEQAVGAEITLVDVAPVSLEESAANARLIAAAPELLEALEAWVDLAERHMADYVLKMDANRTADFAQGIRETKEVLAKAKGENQ